MGKEKQKSSRNGQERNLELDYKNFSLKLDFRFCKERKVVLAGEYFHGIVQNICDGCLTKKPRLCDEYFL